MKRKIFFYYMLLVVLSVTVTGFFIWQLEQRFYKMEVEDKLVNAATLIDYHISQDLQKGIPVDYNDTAKKYTEVLNYSSEEKNRDLTYDPRITFIAFDGTVLGESEADYRQMENHSDRKEIQEAVKGNIGRDIRFSKTMKLDLLYIAIPLKNDRVVLRIAVPLFELNRINELILNYAIFGIIAGLLLTTLLALRFSAFITYPINQLIAVSREISKGNYSKRVEIKGMQELLPFAETFNDMVLKLEKTVADLTDKNIKLDSIINSMLNGIVAVDVKYKVILINSIACQMFGLKNTPELLGTNIMELIRNSQINSYLKETLDGDVSRVNEVLVGSPEEKVLRVYTTPIKSKDAVRPISGGIISLQDITNIKQLEQIRTEFVSNVTHELKTPLTSIRGFIETLRGGAINDPEVAERFLEIIDIEAERLYMLINDILQLSEIENKQKDTNISVHKFKSIVNETLSILEGVAEKKNITLTSDVDENITIAANRDRIKQMLINLIENGIKYNKENGSVHIKAVKEQGKIVIQVKDTGIGIAREHLPRIFERFYRVDKGRSRNMGGTGLGLSIVKHIVNLYNGDIKVSSELGQGTEFVIQLPG
jgi:two-component system, OmpR family, phosphate regulon sensor histidine kinase PhoR